MVDVGDVMAQRGAESLVSLSFNKSKREGSELTKVVDECLCLHAEENALLEAGRERIGEDSVIYCNTYVADLHLPIWIRTSGS
jgi:deoxycytidylate deaminase